MMLLTYRLVNPVGEVLLERYQLATLRRVQPLVVEVGELFLFRRGSRHIGAIEDRDRGRSPATAITGVLSGRESVGVRHRGIDTGETPGVARLPRSLLSLCFSSRCSRILFQDPPHVLRQRRSYSRAISRRNACD